jgi:hypothetical protein
MASPYPTKDVANTIYHSAVITTLAVGYAMIGRKLVKLDVGDPAIPDLTEALKLTIVVTLATATRDWLVKNKIIPRTF